MKKVKIPHMDSIEELARFWDTHDLTEFEDQLEEVTDPVFERKPETVITLHLQPQEVAAVKRVAQGTGSTFATNLIMSAEDFVIVLGRDLLSAYESSPAKHRYFCSGCGSPIYSQAEKTKHIVSVRCGALEVDPIIRPSVHAYVASKAPWYKIYDELLQAPEAFA